jgi:hypothetical protein
MQTQLNRASLGTEIVIKIFAWCQTHKKLAIDKAIASTEKNGGKYEKLLLIEKEQQEITAKVLQNIKEGHKQLTLDW